MSKRSEHKHLWREIGVFYWKPVVMLSNMVPQTSVLRRCEQCQEIETVVLTGTWTLAQVRGKVPADDEIARLP